jgi:hypothetical protein
VDTRQGRRGAAATLTRPPRVGLFDLRQYRLAPGRRDELIDLFDTYFVDGQEQVGIHVVGQFRDLDDPDRFVWLRAFDSSADRGTTLGAFYGGPVWQQHRDTANATMLDSDDALLLEPRHLTTACPRWGTPREAGDTDAVVGITVAYRGRALADADATLADDVALVLDATGATVVAVLTTSDTENTFPALPVRRDPALVWITRFDSEAALAEHARRLTAAADWRACLAGRLDDGRTRVQRLRLRPTRRSHLR